MTEKELLRQLERRINQQYKELDEATRDLIDDFAEDFEPTDKKNKEKLSEQEYKKWRRKFLLQSVVVGTLISKLAKLATKINEESAKEIYKSMGEAYKMGFNGWVKEFNAKYALHLSLADRKAIEHILKGGKILPEPRVDIPKDLRWNERRMRSALMQSVIKGESVPQLSKRLQNAVDMNKTSAVRNARTMINHSHNAGRFEAGLDAIERGIKMDKEWIAHIDDRTRKSHIEMNGEIVPFDEPFSNGLMYPQDLDGDPSEVYNCRCRLGYVLR